MTGDNGSGWVEQFLTPGDHLRHGRTVDRGQVGVRLLGGRELTGRARDLAELGRELFERFSGRALPEGIADPQIVITGNPIEGFAYYGPTPLEDTDDCYRDARTRRIEEQGGEWWLAPLAPMSDLEPVDGDDTPPARDLTHDTAVTPPAGRVRLDVQELYTAVHVLGDGDLSIRAANVYWNHSETCVDAADRALAALGYQRLGEWADADGAEPSHLIGDQDGQYYATTAPLTTHP